MKGGPLRGAVNNISRRAFVSTGAAAILSARVGTAVGEGTVGGQGQGDPLASWNDGPSKDAVVRFVRDATDKSSPKYVEPADRIATFDQDGTLWAEHPLYTQAMSALDRMHEMAPQHPEWRGRYLYTTISGNSVIRSDEAKASP